ncbi:MAG: hypothetical protein IJY52_00495 [Anaerotignum sp.]|nr:hypothetical protein [Anaerotignum sp.]
MHPLFKSIIKKNSVYLVVGAVLAVTGVVSMVAAVVKTVKESKTTMKNALDAYAEKQIAK